MKFGDYSKMYNEVFPRVEPKPQTIVETSTGFKDIEEEKEEEVIDTKVNITPRVEEPEVKEEIPDNGDC